MYGSNSRPITLNQPRSVRPLKPLVTGCASMTTNLTSNTSASVMMETKTPEMRLRKTIEPINPAIATGMIMPIATPNHWF